MLIISSIIVGNGMNAFNNSNDDAVECPLCLEPLEVDDLNFYPCTCGYQICRFCWHRIRTDENELCPACRKAYPENPADFTPLSQEQVIFCFMLPCYRTHYQLLILCVIQLKW